MKINERKHRLVANWKMNGSSQMIMEFLPTLMALTKNSTAMSNLSKNFLEIVICPPAVYLQSLATLLKGQDLIKLGAQNCYSKAKGAYTGEVSPFMLKDCGCEYVILGHSERRQLFQESDELIARKFVAAYDAGLIPILCVGETENERLQGKAFEVVHRQLEAVLEKATMDMLEKSCIAYEPVWAIGTGQTATPSEAEEVHHSIRELLGRQSQTLADHYCILYGGSIKQDNAATLFAEPDIDGGLVGGASLDAKEFFKICESVLTKHNKTA